MDAITSAAVKAPTPPAVIPSTPVPKPKAMTRGKGQKKGMDSVGGTLEQASPGDSQKRESSVELALTLSASAIAKAEALLSHDKPVQTEMAEDVKSEVSTQDATTVDFTNTEHEHQEDIATVTQPVHVVKSVQVPSDDEIRAVKQQSAKKLVQAGKRCAQQCIQLGRCIQPGARGRHHCMVGPGSWH